MLEFYYWKRIRERKLIVVQVGLDVSKFNSKYSVDICNKCTTDGVCTNCKYLRNKCVKIAAVFNSQCSLSTCEKCTTVGQC